MVNVITIYTLLVFFLSVFMMKTLSSLTVFFLGGGCPLFGHPHPKGCVDWLVAHLGLPNEAFKSIP
jgi:hypothetical protein